MVCVERRDLGQLPGTAGSEIQGTVHSTTSRAKDTFLQCTQSLPYSILQFTALIQLQIGWFHRKRRCPDFRQGISCFFFMSLGGRRNGTLVNREPRKGF